jgi:hypothetical protein
LLSALPHPTAIDTIVNAAPISPARDRTKPDIAHQINRNRSTPLAASIV